MFLNFSLPKYLNINTKPFKTVLKYTFIHNNNDKNDLSNSVSITSKKYFKL